MINTRVRGNNYSGYAIRCVLIAVMAFFIVSILVTFSIYMASLPETELIVLTESDISNLSPGELDELMEKSFSSHSYPSYPEYYIQWMGNFFTGDWGESIMPASYYSE